MASAQSFPPKDIRELRKILKLVENVNPIISNMLELSALTGLRYCDCSKLKKRDVLINGTVRRQISIVQQKSYNKRVTRGVSPSAARAASKITVPLNDQAVEVIKDAIYLSPAATFLFESDRKKGSPYTAQYVNRILKKVACELELEYVLSTHSFRKSFALMAIRNGAKVHQIKELLGHASLASTDHYLSTFMGETATIVTKIKF